LGQEDKLRLELLDHLRRGNYGIVGGYGDIHILDSDDLNRWNELGALSLIPKTFTIQSRPGHRQFYLKCKTHFPSGGLFDPEKTKVNGEGKPEHVHIGDLKAVGGQAVAPGSRHPSGTTYTVVVDAPIAEVSDDVINSIISKFQTTKKIDTINKKLEEAVNRPNYEVKDPLDSLRVADIMPPSGAISQSGDELRGDHPKHGSTNGGNFVINVSKNVWHCKRCDSGGGVAQAIAVMNGIISCSDAQTGELRGDLFKEVLKIAREKYLPQDTVKHVPPINADALKKTDRFRPQSGNERSYFSPRNGSARRP
jgi:hypothetical protein